MTTVAITGVWLRTHTAGKYGDKVVEVLVERDGVWRKLGSEHLGGTISHIWEPAGILKAPVDEL